MLEKRKDEKENMVSRVWFNCPSRLAGVRKQSVASAKNP